MSVTPLFLAACSGRGDGLVGRIEPGHRPTLLSEIDGVAALTHPDVERLTRRDAPDHLDEKRVRLDVESGVRRGEDAVPAIDLEPLALLVDDAKLPLDFGRRHTCGGEHLAVRLQRIALLRFARL